MKTLKLLSSLFGAALVAASSVSAITFSDVDVDGNDGEPDWFYMNKNDGRTKHWNNTFNLLEAGFDPLTMKIVRATLAFAFADNGDNDREYVRIKVENETIWDWQEVDGSHHNAPDSYDWYTADVGESLLLALQDGVLDYQVKALSGDYYLKEASLVAEADWITPPSRERANVSDSGLTLTMLGLGVASLVVLRRQALKAREA